MPMFAWFALAVGVLLIGSLLWTSFGPGAKKSIDHRDVREGKRSDVARGDYYGGHRR